MNLSMRWLDEFVHVDTPIHDFCEALTMSGSKVEGYEVEGTEIENVVVGKVLAMERHPNSDHMWICQVDVGKSEPVQIVTGAQNVHVGDLVPAALHKSHLPGGVTITKETNQATGNDEAGFHQRHIDARSMGGEAAKERQGWIDYARKQDDFIRKEIGDETFNKVIGWAKE